MAFIHWIILCFICFIILKSLITFIHGGNLYVKLNMKERLFSMEVFYSLLVIYTIIIIGFGLIYFLFSLNGLILVEHGEMRQASALGSLIHSLYFSGVTLLTIGYGDIVPIGIGRLISLIQALIGYVLPTAFVLRIVQTEYRNKSR